MKSITLSLLFTVCTITSLLSQNLSGVWHGTLVTPANKEVIFVFLFEEDGNRLKTTIAIPTYDVAGIKADSTALIEGKLTIDAPELSMAYEGYWDESTNKIEGKYREGNIQLDLTLTKGKPEIAKLSRPQEPVRPYPYYEEHVRFHNEQADVTLAGTFTRPTEKGKYPVVILISGSGPQGRNESWMGHRPFLVLSDHLTRKGIAVLRYDDRGFGESTGDFGAATTADFAQDVLSAVRYLKTRNDIDVNQIGLIGHSEGGIIAPLAANQTPDIAFLVILAGTGIPGSEISVMQVKTMTPFPIPDEEDFEQNVRKAIEIATSDAELAQKRIELAAHNESYIEPILTSLGASQENISKLLENETETLLRPWNRYFFSYNPSDEFEKLSIPVLSLNGTKDVQVDATINQDAIRKALIKGGNENYKILSLDGLNHLFQECETGKIEEYKEIEQTMSPIALEEISKWVLETVQMK